MPVLALDHSEPNASPPAEAALLVAAGLFAEFDLIPELDVLVAPGC